MILYMVVWIRPYRVDGDSMYPSLRDGSYVLVDSILPKITGLGRSDVIVYNSQQSIYTKRILGLPWETLHIKNSHVYTYENSIENETLEPYLRENTKTCVPGSCINSVQKVYDVPKKHYFVLWDNREDSRDSRWCISAENCENDQPFYVSHNEIIGKVIFWW